MIETVEKGEGAKQWQLYAEREVMNLPLGVPLPLLSCAART
jgi:hypothetical protein